MLASKADYRDPMANYLTNDDVLIVSHPNETRTAQWHCIGTLARVPSDIMYRLHVHQTDAIELVPCSVAGVRSPMTDDPAVAVRQNTGSQLLHYRVELIQSTPSIDDWR